MHETGGCTIENTTIYIDSEPVSVSLLQVSQSRILKLLGVPEGDADDYLLGIIHDLINKCKTICSPRSGCSIFTNPEFIPEQYQMVLGDTTFDLHKRVTSALAKSESIAVFIGTCGDQVEIFSRQLIKDGNALEGYITDLIGSEIAEGVADLIHQKLTVDMALSGIKTTNRYSPGYCNWPVNDQQQLFSLLKHNTCGVQLTSSSLMLPIKSVSGVIGLGKLVTNNGYACAQCDAGYCLYRDAC